MIDKDLLSIIEEGYKRRIKHFEMEKKQYDIVLAGDSLIAFMHVNKLFPNLSIMNQGISGDTTKGLHERIKYIVKVTPKKVFINIGSNDLVILKHTPEEVVYAIKNIMQELYKHIENLEVYIFNITPVNPDLKISNHAFIFGRTNQDIDKINELISQEFDKNIIINIHDLVIDKNKKLAEKYTTDGIHFNDSGYEIFQSLIYKKL